MTSISPRRLALVGLLVAGGSAGLVGGAIPAGADHAAEKITLSKTTDLVDGDAVTVTFSGFAAGGKPAKVVIAGQGKLVTLPDKLNFEEYGAAPSAEVGADGTGTLSLIAVADHGTVQDGTTLNCMTQQCWAIVVQEPFLPQPNYAAVPIYFAGGSVRPEGAATETSAAETTAAPETTAAAETTAAPETTASAEPTDTADDVAADPEDTKAGATDEAKDSDDGGNGALYGIIAAVVALVGVGAFLLSKKKAAE